MLVGALFMSLRLRMMPDGNLAHTSTTLSEAKRTRRAGLPPKLPANTSIAVQVYAPLAGDRAPIGVRHSASRPAKQSCTSWRCQTHRRPAIAFGPRGKAM
jgi:hypothetical protein